MDKKEIDPVLYYIILDVLKKWDIKNRGFWYGHDILLRDVKNMGCDTNIDNIKRHLRQLYKDNKILVMPIFNECNGKLNGKGYFYNNCNQ